MEEEWIQMRKNKSINIEWLYKWYLEHRLENAPAPILPIQIFYKYVMLYLSKIIEYLDQYFEIQFIQDDEGNIIYMV